MKYIVNQPELLAFVKEFVKNPDAEFPMAEVENKLTKTKELKPTGFTQKQQAILITSMLCEAVFTDASPEQFATALQIVHDLGNASAARQTLEKLGILGETPGGKRGTDVAALAAKWMPKSAAPETSA